MMSRNATPRRLRRGARIAGYRVEGLLHRGKSGAIYLGDTGGDAGADRVAIKILQARGRSEAWVRARFAREARAAEISHPNVIPIREIGEQRRLLYIVMEYAQDGTLGSLIHRHGPLSPWRTGEIVRQVASALDTVHAQGIVHRDIKPPNILVRGDTCCLADFGSSGTIPVEPRPHRGGPAGTRGWRAPEELRGDRVDGRADQYALGLIAYICLTGESPFDGDSDESVARAHLQDEPPAIKATLPDAPEEIDAVLARALAKDPDLRFPNCAGFANAFSWACSPGAGSEWSPAGTG